MKENNLAGLVFILMAYSNKCCLRFLRSAKTADKRMLLFTNEDDPFRNCKGAAKIDMKKMTLQRAKVGFARHFLMIFVQRNSFS